MQLSALLGKAGGTPQSPRRDGRRVVGEDEERGGFQIIEIKLTVRGKVDGLDEAGFQKLPRRPSPAARSARPRPASRT